MSRLVWGGLALVVALALVAGAYLYSRFDEQLRRLIQGRLGEHYQELIVEVGSARWISGQGIELRQVAIREPEADGPQSDLTVVDEVFVASTAQVADLVNGLPRFHELVLRRPTLRATRRGEREWSVTRLLPLPGLTGGYPRIVIEQGTIEIADPLRNPSATLTLRDVHLVLTPPEGSPEELRALAQLHYTVEGHLVADHARYVDVRGRLSWDGTAFELSGNVDELNFCPELQAALPELLGELIRPAAGLRAEARLAYRVDYDAARDEPWDFSLEGTLEGGRWEDSHLPYPLSDLRARLRCDRGGLVVEDCTARNGSTQLWMTCRRDGYGADSPVALKGMGRRIMLDERWARLEGVPVEWRDQWNRFLPAGEMDVDFEARYDQAGWRPVSLVARLRDLSFTYAGFPYRLERAEGSVELKEERLRLSLKAQSQGEEVRLTGLWNQATQGGAGWLKITADDLPLDQKLFDALPEQVSRTVKALHPRGNFRVDARFEHAAGSWDRTPHYEVVVGLEHCQVRYDPFSYPLNEVRGTIRVVDGLWTFEKLSGTNDTGHLECNGRLEPTAEGWLLVLGFTGQNVPLDEELRDSLADPRLRELWNEFHPRGAINFQSQLSYLAGQPQMHLWARVWPIPEKTSIEPTYFPYRLENLGGELFFQDRHVDFRGLTASHGATRLAEASGSCDLWPDGGWKLAIERVAIERLEADRDLASALPPRLRDLVRQLDPQGALGVEGQVNLMRGPAADAPVTSDWRLDVDVHDGRLTVGTPLEHLHGAIALTGRSDGKNIECRGELAIDSAMHRDVQLANLRGPVRFTNEQVLFGAAAEPPVAGRPPRRITAEVCGGLAYGDGLATLTAPVEYRFDAALVNADLARAVRELADSQAPLSGKVSGQVRLTGRGNEPFTRRGAGQLQLREANIYESPVMVRMLSVVSVRPPDQSAFTESDVDFRIDGEHVYFDRIQFKGDVISLRGRGEMDAQTNLNLDFFAMVGREPWNLPLVGGVLRGASQQIMQIHVDGRLSDPQVTRETLPGVKKGLQSLGIDWGRSNERPLWQLVPQATPAAESPQGATRPPAEPIRSGDRRRGWWR